MSLAASTIVVQHGTAESVIVQDVRSVDFSAHICVPFPLTQAPLYSDKAKLFPDSTFAIGYDTAERLVAPRYYGGNDGMLLSMAALHGARCRVLVAGRVQGASSQADGEAGDAGADKFLTLADLEMPPDLRELVRCRV
jgi:hypothetical protein